MTATFTSPSLAHSLRVRWLVERQQRLEIGQRIRELRENSAETNRSIAEYVGVGERSVAAWIAGGGITYDHAKKVGELFDIDIDWLWRGREQGPTPDPFATGSTAAVDELRGEVASLRLELLAEIGKVRDALVAPLPLQEPGERGEEGSGT